MIEALIICLWSIVANGNDTSGLLVYLGYVSGTNFTLINGVFPFKVMVKKICEILAGKHQLDFVPKRNFIFCCERSELLYIHSWSNDRK